MENNKPVLTDSIINLNALSNGLNTMAFTVPTLYLTMFMTDYLGISPVAMGTGMLIAKTSTSSSPWLLVLSLRRPT